MTLLENFWYLNKLLYWIILAFCFLLYIFIAIITILWKSARPVSMIVALSKTFAWFVKSRYLQDGLFGFLKHVAFFTKLDRLYIARTTQILIRCFAVKISQNLYMIVIFNYWCILFSIYLLGFSDEIFETLILFLILRIPDFLKFFKILNESPILVLLQIDLIHYFQLIIYTWYINILIQID